MPDWAPMSDIDKSCGRCGAAAEEMISRRVFRAKRGHVNILQGEACGDITSKDIPQQLLKS